MAVALVYLENHKQFAILTVHILLLLIPQHFLRNNTEHCLVLYFTSVLHYLFRKMLNLMTVRRKYNRNLINFSVLLRSAQDDLTNYISLSNNYICKMTEVKFVYGEQLNSSWNVIKQI